MILIKPTLYDLILLCHNSRPDEIEQWEALIGPWDADEAANNFFNNAGPKFLLANDDGPVVAGGWIPVIDGVYQSWMVGTEESWAKHWRSITKASRRVMDVMLKDGIARRLQTSAIESRARACEWYVRGLKMHHESTSVGFGMNGENMVNYARFPNG